MGIVDELRVANTQKGNTWISFFLEDAEGRIRIQAFGEAADKLKTKVKDNTVYFIEIAIRNSANPLISPKKVCDIDKFISQRFKEIEVDLDLESIDDSMTDRMTNLFFQLQGDKKLKFNIFAADENCVLESTQKVGLSHQILTYFRENHLQFSLR